MGLGDLASRLGAVPLHRILLCSDRRTATLPLPDGVALSRELFDAALVEQAIGGGAEFLPETIVGMPFNPGATRSLLSTLHALRSEDSASRLHGRSFVEQRSRTTRQLELRQRERTACITARIVVVADGLAGRLLAEEQPSVALPASRIGAGAISVNVPAFFEAGIVYMTCSENGYVGLVRLEDQRLDIAAALDPARVRALGSPAAVVANILAETGWPTIEGLAALSWRGTPMLTRRRCCVATERLFIVGDAAGYVEPFTGEGIAWALNSAIALAPIVDGAIAHWSPNLMAEWAREHRRLLGSRQRSCRLAARALRSRLLTRILIAVLSLAPVLARPFLRRLNRTSALI